MWLKWLPWRFVVRRVARARGFIDPISLLSHLHRFAQPSEVAAPLELLRAGVVFHARGLMNTGAIQHNLDWVWPYWVERQFDPDDESFIPRAFSITHVNLTHRNWTAVGWPDHDWLPIVDPRGLLTPLWDGWSLDAWVLPEEGQGLIPSKLKEVSQRLDFSQGLSVATDSALDSLSLRTSVWVELEGENPVCRQVMRARADRPGWLAVVLRPYNPEGVSFIHSVGLGDGRKSWLVDEGQKVQFSHAPDRTNFSTYRIGDVATRLPQGSDQLQAECDVGMATAAALFRLEPHEEREITLSVPLARHSEPGATLVPRVEATSWPAALEGHCRLQSPDKRFQYLYDAAIRTLILHSPGDVYPGPYTYKRFWFRDAAFILNAMLYAGLSRRVGPVLRLFPSRQTRAGYYLSQEGEWDSNGAAIWVLDQFRILTGEQLPSEWVESVRKGARWILKKLTSPASGKPHAGLLPAGFSAEHLGPNDFYYWDDFWAVAGLRSAANLVQTRRGQQGGQDFREAADKLLNRIWQTVEVGSLQRGRPGIPASPYRRMDAGAIGSVVAGYPLQLCDARDPRLLATADFLIDHSFFKGGFFQDMIHSGVNAYLTLHVAQVLLRAGDPRYLDMMKTVAELASPTGQWPEAIHPRTHGGCMGDGQHVWAAAEWIMMVRNCFVREEGRGLVIGSGVPADWLAGDREAGDLSSVASLGPTPTPYGNVSVAFQARRDDRVVLRLQCEWRSQPATIQARLPGFEPREVQPGETEITLVRAGP